MLLDIVHRISDVPSRPSRTELQPLPLDDVLRNNSTLARVAAIARRAGVEVNVGDIENEISTSDMYTNSPICKQYFQVAKHFQKYLKSCFYLIIIYFRTQN